MLTLEVYGEVITWPDDFALMMIKYYRDSGVPYKVCGHQDNDGRE